MRAPLALLRLRRARAAGQLVRLQYMCIPGSWFLVPGCMLELHWRGGRAVSLARGRHRQNAMGISTALGAGVAPLVCRLARVSAMVPAACVFYVKSQFRRAGGITARRGNRGVRAL